MIEERQYHKIFGGGFDVLVLFQHVEIDIAWKCREDHEFHLSFIFLDLDIVKVDVCQLLYRRVREDKAAAQVHTANLPGASLLWKEVARDIS